MQSNIDHVSNQQPEPECTELDAFFAADDNQYGSFCQVGAGRSVGSGALSDERFRGDSSACASETVYELPPRSEYRSPIYSAACSAKYFEPSAIIQQCEITPVNKLACLDDVPKTANFMHTQRSAIQ